jgi:hypothetical protein
MIKSVIITDLSTAVSTSFKDCIQTVWISAVDEADDLLQPVKEWKQLNNDGIYTGGW